MLAGIFCICMITMEASYEAVTLATSSLIIPVMSFTILKPLSRAYLKTAGSYESIEKVTLSYRFC